MSGDKASAVPSIPEGFRYAAARRQEEWPGGMGPTDPAAPRTSTSYSRSRRTAQRRKLARKLAALREKKALSQTVVAAQ